MRHGQRVNLRVNSKGEFKGELDGECDLADPAKPPAAEHNRTATRGTQTQTNEQEIITKTRDRVN